MSRKTKPKPEQPVTYKGYNKYEVTFTQNNNKYNKTTRTVTTYAINDYAAERLVHVTFGSIPIKKMIPTPGNRITINKVTKVQDGKEKEVN